MSPHEAVPSSSMAPSSSAQSFQRSPWHSPVPYLFGGLAAMLGLIAFALLILACSYWKLSGNMENHEGDRDIETGDYSKPDNYEQRPPVFEEKYLVIMAGQVKPTFLATAVSSSFGSCSSFDNSTDGKSSTSEEETTDEKNREIADQVP